MDDVARKTEVSPIDGTPEKRLFWSIISDYDLQTGICELIDNAIDIWTSSQRARELRIDIALDPIRQIISVTDNAGGVSSDSLRLLVVPGGSSNDPSGKSIGIFGVGSKRASIALGEHVEIRTRKGNGISSQIDVTKDWLENEDWEIPVYSIPPIKARSTTVEISQLRSPFSQEDIDRIADRLGEIYSLFISRKCQIRVNNRVIKSQKFDKWAYPPGQEPQKITFKVEAADKKIVTVEIVAGLIRDRDPELDNYGAYFYCNDRLIVKELKAREVGYFVSSEAGVPHPDASLCRAIVKLNGAAQAMPWTSNKTGINYAHPIFQELQSILRPLVSHFSKLSRRTKNDWAENVFPHTKGTISKQQAPTSGSSLKLVLPELPKVRKLQAEKLKQKNRKQILEQPWTLGLVESISLIEIITRQKLDTKNRAALLLLDSNFEIALKEFIINRQDLFPHSQFSDRHIKELFKRRDDVIGAITNHVPIPEATLKRIGHYYKVRNKLIHERATVDITDTDIKNFRKAVEQVLKKLFSLKF
ncbi:MAG: ATP-binding protein [Parvibaculaceae bacterium]|nr:ATP-binding protein [Parvibaculaceae bacterium]|tara:strand:+ start:371 stop:1963 length:1593 start_codon:yes stop_codon:yes gene_type:complete